MDAPGVELHNHQHGGFVADCPGTMTDSTVMRNAALVFPE